MAKIRVQRPDEEIVELEEIPYRVEEEHFNYYTPNVGRDHPLFGRTIKQKTVTMKIAYGGSKPDGTPIVHIWSHSLVDVEGDVSGGQLASRTPEDNIDMRDGVGIKLGCEHPGVEPGECCPHCKETIPFPER